MVIVWWVRIGDWVRFGWRLVGVWVGAWGDVWVGICVEIRSEFGWLDLGPVVVICSDGFGGGFWCLLCLFGGRFRCLLR